MSFAASNTDVTNASNKIVEEYYKAREKFNKQSGPHEGYAIILEELDELWDAVKANDIEHARREAVQVAAMAMAFMIEV